MEILSGIGVALVTPFDDEKKIDFSALEKLVDHVVSGGVHYLVVQGTTGESATLSDAEKKLVLKTVLEVNQGRLPVVYGIGGNNTMAVALQMKDWEEEGVSAFLSVSPYYNKPNQAGIIEHYRALDRSTELPIILYNVPGRTGVNIKAETTLAIADTCKKVIGIKEASGDLDQMTKLLKNSTEEFYVISGDDNLVLPQLSMGADGVISVIANAFPRELVQMYDDFVSGNLMEAREIHFQLSDIIPLLFVDGNPAGVKAALKHLNICSENVRLPLTGMNSSNRDALIYQITKAGL